MKISAFTESVYASARIIESISPLQHMIKYVSFVCSYTIWEEINVKKWPDE